MVFDNLSILVPSIDKVQGRWEYYPTRDLIMHVGCESSYSSFLWEFSLLIEYNILYIKPCILISKTFNNSITKLNR